MARPTHRSAPHLDGARPGRARAVGLAITGLVLLAACSPATDRTAPTPGPTAPTTPSRPEATTGCPEEGVRIRSLGTDAAMGLRALGLELVNCGTRPYPLHGYPALRLFDADGTPIPVQVVNGATGITSGFDQPPRALTLRPGERARAAVLWRNLVTDATVTATHGERLEVAPAVGRPARVLDLDGPIDLGNTGRLGVSAWKKADPATETASPDVPTPSRSAPLL
ncbi:DUF4232 domain-containing protein [Micromonospora sp. NPDC047670]|uniref:DUF4232 domain-containing protein n=1 Tax=Micromonospora sp. NPDC047670 TaxID=3364252 RepID=UPI003713ECF3